MAKEAKTNAMRMLERAKVAYTAHEYPHEEGQAVDGANVARLTGQDPARVFKTLVTQGADRSYYVFVVPVLAELDLKKAAKAAGIPVGMCGEGAADPRLIPHLLEWGLDEFSVSAASILKTRKMISEEEA